MSNAPAEKSLWRHGDRHTGPGGGRLALDIGSGDGALARHLADRGFTTTGLDCAPSALALAGTGPSSAAVTFCRADFESPRLPPLAERAFAVVTARLAYAFIKDEPAFLSRVRGLLAPRGLFWVVTPLTSRVPTGQAAAADPSASTGPAMPAGTKPNGPSTLSRAPGPSPPGTTRGRTSSRARGTLAAIRLWLR